jgi:hypothetical protein
MSVIIVSVGQCGNQLGERLWRDLHRCCDEGRAASPFFAPSGHARAVLVDSEPKVVMGLLQRNQKIFRGDSAACSQSGRGNNWGLGYHGIGNRGNLRHKAFAVNKDQRLDDSLLIGKALCAVHREALRVDRNCLEAIVVLHSLAGGTGSGVTSKLVEKLRLYFTAPSSEEAERMADETMEADGLGCVYGERRRALYIVSICVAPQIVGENSLQSINTVLTLDALQRNTDAIVVLRNDEGFSPAPLGPIKALNSFDDVNAMFSLLLLPLLYFGGSARAVGELIAKCAPDGRFKMLSLLPLPQRNFSRFSNCALLSREYKLKGPANSATAPGAPLEQIHTQSSRRLLDAASSCVVVTVPRAFVAGCASGMMPLDILVLNQVEEMNRNLFFPLLRDCKYKLESKAFLHQFEASGVDSTFIEAAFRRVVVNLCYDQE